MVNNKRKLHHGFTPLHWREKYQFSIEVKSNYMPFFYADMVPYKRFRVAMNQTDVFDVFEYYTKMLT
jgi:hypothetical protein